MTHLLNVANLIPYKGHRDLIQAFSIVAEEESFVYLHIAGEDRGIGPELLELAKELGVRSQVKLYGRVEDVKTFYSLADIYVHSSHEEGCSNAIIEAMWAGLPVVATNVGGVPELVEHEETGLLVPARDPQAMAAAILSILNDPIRKRIMGRRGAELAKMRFTKAAMIENYRKVYVCAA